MNSLSGSVPYYRMDKDKIEWRSNRTLREMFINTSQRSVCLSKLAGLILPACGLRKKNKVNLLLSRLGLGYGRAQMTRILRTPKTRKGSCRRLCRDQKRCLSAGQTDIQPS